MSSGLSADEIANRLGISRSALYSLEQGKIAKIDTLQKVAELIEAPVAALLGVGVECIPSPVSYFERLLQLEKSAEHIIALSGSIPFLLSSHRYLEFLAIVLKESVPSDLPERESALAQVDTIMSLLSERKKAYEHRRPSVLSLVSSREIKSFVGGGFAAGIPLSNDEFFWRREFVRAEIQHLTDVIDEQSFNVQVGIVEESLPHTRFQIFRMSDSKVLTITPFRLSERPNVRLGIAIVTSAVDAVELHEKVVQDMWRGALKGPLAGDHLRGILKEFSY
jgi:transcriptional regulator with XRE-family HTH domain